jgi:hypothetical protein
MNYEELSRPLTMISYAKKNEEQGSIAGEDYAAL